MGAFTSWPYANWHELNLDWIIGKIKEFQDELGSLEDAVEKLFELLNDLDPKIKDEVRAVLNRWLDDGTLADIINQEVFGEFNERLELQEEAPYQYEAERHEKYVERVRKNLASWLEADYLSTSFEGNEKGKAVDVGVYGGYRYSNNGYIKAPLDQFDYGLHRNVKDPYSETVYDISYMPSDCTTFVSLITKGYNFEDSIYKDSVLNVPYNRTKAITQAIDTYHETRNDYIGYDGNNNITTHEWAEGLYYSGAHFRQISFKEYGGIPEIDLDAINELETGDIIFFGIGNESREDQFYGIHHDAIYVRSLDEINQYLSDGRRLRISDTLDGNRYNTNTEWGYIIHIADDGVYNINGEQVGTPGVNVLRVDTLNWAINKLYQYGSGGELNKWRTVYGVKVQPNTLNIAGGFEASTSIRNSFGKFRVTNWSDRSCYYTVRTSNGGVQSGSLGSSGVRMTYNNDEPIDFNTLLENGDYVFRSSALSESNSLNRPCSKYGVLHVRNNQNVEMFKDTSVTTLSLLIQEFEAMDNQYYYKIQRHVRTGGTPRQFTQWKLIETTDPRGTDMSQYEEGFIPTCETLVKPIIVKYF